MMQNYSFDLPTTIEFGRGTINILAESIKDRGYKKPMFVTDKGLAKTGLLKPMEQMLKDAGIEYEMFSDTVPNPRDIDCDKGAQYAKETKIDSLIAVGGGSAMDTAKAIATVMTNGGLTRDWFDVELGVQSLPVICIPTTCGTGSEVTFNAVITDTKTHLKGNIYDAKCAPVLALVDPDVLDSLPEHLISSTGMDALTHAIEAYISTEATPMTDMVAMTAITQIKGHILDAGLKKDKAALDNLMLGSMLAGIAFGNADTAAVHCISECFGGYFDMPHGVTNSIFLAAVSKYSIAGNPGKYKKVAELLGADIKGLDETEAAMKGVEAIEILAEKLKIPKLKEFKQVKQSDFDFLAEASEKHPCNPSNPVEFTKEQYLQIFNEVYNEK